MSGEYFTLQSGVKYFPSRTPKGGRLCPHYCCCMLTIQKTKVLLDIIVYFCGAVGGSSVGFEDGHLLMGKCPAPKCRKLPHKEK